MLVYIVSNFSHLNEMRTHHQNHFPGCCLPKCYCSRPICLRQNSGPCLYDGTGRLFQDRCLFGFLAPVMPVTKLSSLVVTFSLTLCTEAAFAAMVDAIPPKIHDIIVDQVCAFRQTERRRPDICKKIKTPGTWQGVHEGL